MAVPAHDERDYEFAKKFNLDIVEVLSGGDISKEAWTQDGIHVNSGFLDGLGKEEALTKMNAWLKENNFGEAKITYKLRDWLFSRQRYWVEQELFLDFLLACNLPRNWMIRNGHQRKS